MFLQLWNFLESRVSDEDGATMVEYGILVAVIAVVVMAGAILLGAAINTLFSSTAGSL